MDSGALILEKLSEYRMMLAPLERVEQDVDLARKLLRARTEDELNKIAPVLGALADTLHVSTLDLLLASDRPAFLQDAMERSGLTVEEIRLRLIAISATAREDLKLLGIAGPLQG